MFQILREVAETYPRRGMMVLISDLLTERRGLFRGLKLLRSRGHDVLVFHVLDDDELDFPFTGPTRFDGLELPEMLRCNPRALRGGLPGRAGSILGGSAARLHRQRRGLRAGAAPASRWTPPWPPT